MRNLTADGWWRTAVIVFLLLNALVLFAVSRVEHKTDDVEDMVREQAVGNEPRDVFDPSSAAPAPSVTFSGLPESDEGAP